MPALITFLKTGINLEYFYIIQMFRNQDLQEFTTLVPVDDFLVSGSKISAAQMSSVHAQVSHSHKYRLNVVVAWVKETNNMLGQIGICLKNLS